MVRCEKCKDTGVVKEANGTIHTCFDCLNRGSMDQHTTPKDSGKRV